ncbi:chalcone isomerase family protein [Desulfococcus sp.]|uniref:chalcone isomerase family protein n=1 Tax=Desulfococcus sp. TaxID=2025834 RepID=UPI0035932ECD
MLKRLAIIGWIALVVFPTLSFAVDIGGVTLPDSLTAGNVPLVLNGAGLREKFFVKVYAGALYLQERSADSRKIIEAEEPMAIRMHFIHDGVSSRKLIETWNEGFQQSTGGNIAPIAPQIEKFNACFSEDARSGDIYDIIYTPGQGVRVYNKNQLRGAIQGNAFKKSLFAIWLGEKPADKGLKEGMLGN